MCCVCVCGFDLKGELVLYIYIYIYGNEMYIGKRKKTLAVLIETGPPRSENPRQSLDSQSLAGAGLAENLRRDLLKQMLYRLVH